MKTASQRERTVLCREREVALESLPRCLRHYGENVPLEDAIRLTKMLDILFMSFEGGDWTDGKEGLKGVSLVLDLLLDKLEIASGEYKFPLLDHGRDALVLVERVKDR